MIHELKWAGVEADEGVCLDENGKITEVGECGPYIQSERVEKGIYNKYAEELIERGYAYYCFCSKERLDDVKNQQKADGKIPRYDGLCRGVSIEDAKKRIANGESYVIRLKLRHLFLVVIGPKIYAVLGCFARFFVVKFAEFKLAFFIKI